MAKARTVIEEELVKARIEKACKDYPRLRQMWDGLIWWLSKNPQAGTRIPNIPVERYVYYVWSWAPGGLPSISVTYQVTENEIIIERSLIDFSRASKKGS